MKNFVDEILMERNAIHLAITEWSISRAYREYQKSGAEGLAVLTSWRSDKTHAENLRNWESFKSEAGSLGHGYKELAGMGMEKDAATGREIQVREPSLWVNGMTLQKARTLADRYEQYAFLYSGPETGGAMTLFNNDGTQKVLWRFSPTKPLPSPGEVAAYWSDWRKRSFHYVEMAHPVQNTTEGLGYRAQIIDMARKYQR